MANPGTAAIANATDNTTAGTSSLRNFITTPFEERRARIISVRREVAPFTRRTFLPWPLDRVRGGAGPVKILVAQLEPERDRRNHVHGLAVHPHRLASPLLYRGHRCVGKQRVAFQQLLHFDLPI